MKLISGIYSIILFILSTSPLYHNTATLEVNFCGYEQTCSNNITKQALPSGACCKPCECEDICIEKGTCCRDKEKPVDADINAKQKCLAAAYTPNGVPLPEEILTFYTRTSCPVTYDDIDIKAKCEVDTPGTITDIIPVLSRDGKVLYKNKYCSYCHGEKMTYSWDVTVHGASSQTCRESLQSETINIETVSTKILSNCILEFRPPSNILLL
ncbi:uncharacterized protein LOC132745377 [Ruditapes philippinarum]|uniref:uncharacterized protein LOC132745377 n=1 Tax=Ruditapes philippinarum TaxID=129788 RepID=UPI00295BE40E|nr:uncharacterized protein LOC132745377 [Ruditapes philippinarum]